MKRCEVSTTINRTVADVYAYLADARYQTEWRGDVATSTLHSGDAATVGSVYEQTQPWMRRLYRSLVELAELEINQTVGFRTIHETSMPVSGTFSLAPDGGGTRITARIEMRSRGLARLAEPILGLTMPRTARGQLSALKAALESPA